MLGVALNEVFVPLLQKQFPEIVDFYLPPEGCSYRMAIVSIKKQYAGHAKRVMFGIWSYLRQFMYTKFIIVVDDDIDIRNWQEVIWGLPPVSIRYETPCWSRIRRLITLILPVRCPVLAARWGWMRPISGWVKLNANGVRRL